jgi:hypothetical protein
MKKIIRLTESDLARIVKRVIKEAEAATTGGGYTQNAKTAIGLIEKGMGGVGTDENMVAKGVYTIKTKEDYSHVLKHANAKGFKTIMDWINSDWQEVSHGSNLFGVASSSNKQISDLGRHLRQFNPDESGSTYTVRGSSPGRTFNDGKFGSQHP